VIAFSLPPLTVEIVEGDISAQASGFPLAECAVCMIDAIRAYAKAARSVRLVRLVLFGMPAYEIFVQAAERAVWRDKTSADPA
jgi:O-acetyl-ADP-ribose deacetylase (regulator of RNase III)